MHGEKLNDCRNCEMAVTSHLGRNTACGHSRPLSAVRHLQVP
jgi:hypothetical protein